jgi:transcription termination factor Rho
MYEIATLKTKKLPELQEIAKKIGVKRIAGLKKLDLIYQIVDFIASKPDDEPAKTAPAKPKKAMEEATEKKDCLKGPSRSKIKTQKESGRHGRPKSEKGTPREQQPAQKKRKPKPQKQTQQRQQ